MNYEEEVVKDSGNHDSRSDKVKVIEDRMNDFTHMERTDKIKILREILEHKNINSKRMKADSNLLTAKKAENKSETLLFTNEKYFDAKKLSLNIKSMILEMTHENYQNNDVYRTILYTYKWFMDENTLFTLLFERFQQKFPLILSPSEREIYKETVISKIQSKVLVFLMEWIKLYSDFIIKDKGTDEVLFNFLFLICIQNTVNHIIKKTIEQILNEIEKIEHRWHEKSIEPYMKITLLSEIFIPLHIILKYNHLLAKQLCIFDNENYKKIRVSEFVNKSWSSAEKYILSPNITYIGEMATKLSRLISYFILMNKKNMIRIMLFQYLIDLCDQLLRLRNFNSAYAIFLGLETPAVKRLNEILEPNLGKEYKKTLEFLQSVFSTKNHMENLRIKQSEANVPAVPHLGQYLSDLFFMEEDKYIQSKSSQTKYKVISSKIHKILSFKESYTFHRVNDIIHYFKCIPYISEDQIYDLSYKVLPL